MRFNVEDRVSWKSFLGKTEIVKTGEVVLILQPGENLGVSLESLRTRFSCYPIWNEGDIRDNISYAVLMRDGTARPRLYLLNEDELTRIYYISKFGRERKIKNRRLKKK